MGATRHLGATRRLLQHFKELLVYFIMCYYKTPRKGYYDLPRATKRWELDAPPELLRKELLKEELLRNILNTQLATNKQKKRATNQLLNYNHSNFKLKFPDNYKSN